MSKLPRPKLTYANVVSSLCLFLLLGGGAAFAAQKIRSGDIARGAVRTNALHQRAVSSGKLALGAVRSNQIASGAVDSQQIANGAISGEKVASDAIGARQIAPGSLSSTEIAPASISPGSLQVPLNILAKATGGEIPIPANGGEEVAYPLQGASWTQRPGQVVVFFAGGTTSLAYDGSGSGSCQVGIGIYIDGNQVGGGGTSTSSEVVETKEQNFGAGTEIDPPQTKTRTMVAKVQSNGDCTADSVIDASRFQVVGFG